MRDILANPLLFGLGLIGILLAISGLLSACETAITGASPARTQYRAAAGESRRAQLAAWLMARREHIIAAILLGNNMVNILASAIAASLFIRAFGEAGIIYATIAMTCLVVVFAEILPKTWAITRSDKILHSWARFLFLVAVVFGPAARAAQIFVSFLLAPPDERAARQKERAQAAREELLGAIALHRAAGHRAPAMSEMLGGVLDLEKTEIADVMVHRTQIITFDADSPPAALLEEILQCGHSRVPLWRQAPDDIIGILYVRDLLRAALRAASHSGGRIETLNIAALARPAWFVPETTSLSRQLAAFLKSNNHLALAVDEYGGLMGLVTLEDILEEIVGEIGAEEYEEEEKDLVMEEDGSVLADGRQAIRDCNRAFGWRIPGEESATLSGLLIHHARRIPHQGEYFDIHGLRFEVVARSRRRLRTIKITKLAAD